MQIINTVKEMQSVSRWFRGEGKSRGFVPTMGALHEGHLSLVRRARGENERAMVSIFINPPQFGPEEDFQKYPRDIEGDLAKLAAENVDVVFIPDNSEMYPDGFTTAVNVGRTGQILCGKSRPGHFTGVATVVAKLLNSVMPERTYVGQKDYQQSVVIKKLVKELNFDSDIVTCPTVREPDGLAMSSRNAYLSQEERRAAAVVYRALKLGEEIIHAGKLDNMMYVKKELEKIIKSEPLAKIEYIDIVDPNNLDSLERVIFAAVICLAVTIGSTRLIDNIIVEKG